MKAVHWMGVLAALLVIAVGPSTAAAKPGSLDTSFGERGLASIAIPGTRSEVSAIAVQPDGGVVVARADGIVRLRWDGSRDDGFTSPTLPIDDLVAGPDGRLVRVAGDTVERRLADGSPDPSFGFLVGGGVQLVGLELGTIALQPDGKIVLGGHDNASGDLVVVRLLPNGVPDRGFGSEGVARVAVSGAGTESRDYARSVAVAPDGRVLVAGSTGANESPDCIHCWGPYLSAVVLRLLPDGRLDGSFGQRGIFRAAGPMREWGGAEGIAPRPGGGAVFVASQATGVILAGEFGVGFTVGALTSRGRLDKSFAGDGVSASFNGLKGESFGPAATALSVRRDGQILVVGGHGTPNDFMLELLRLDGRPNRRFGHGGFVSTKLGDSKYYGWGATATAPAPHGRFYVAGRSRDRLVVARYLQR